ncbi:phosphatase PAP2 family protein [Stenotrophomonas sp. TWI143]|uniref:phosphatase PAP2 family protein n=1 Tax=Stenotrophomonas sp. TWI143 TaxID=3136771 RepID=UPI002988E848|nr:phosphatase PAP2 family protein [Stenotrophomonas maltophilia]HDS1233472.1 phosphatase PAP2 family protein [Stenotrophomonas maltophilia]HEL3862706.1 phosphatase PAP2 family protein [Stenotrophomonas maltophilia]HEL4288212.1 phosphatase PAP2 family protein [Stenotrophomonas maltophilia]
MSEFWLFLSNLGDSRWLLPMAMVLLLALPRSESSLRRRWAVAIAVTAGLTVASKLAFMGWGIGIRRLDFTGISGHAAMSSVVYPVALWLTVSTGERRDLRWFAAGSLLAGAIGYSRLPIQAHSTSEVISGLALGLAASCAVLGTSVTPSRPKVRVLLLAGLMGLAVPAIMSDLRTHDIIKDAAKLLSGRSSTHERHDLGN